MSNTAPTMSHTPEQRKAWHAGKRKFNLSGNLESRAEWFSRVFLKNKNFSGAYTPRRFRIAYKPLNNRQTRKACK